MLKEFLPNINKVINSIKLLLMTWLSTWDIKLIIESKNSEEGVGVGGGGWVVFTLVEILF